MSEKNCLMTNKEVENLTQDQQAAVAAALDALDVAVSENLPVWLLVELRQARHKMIKAFDPDAPQR